jgi:hypothetical protein
MLLFALLACAPDYAVHEICLETHDGFDIEAVSVLQDAAGYPGSRDAVVLDLAPGGDVEAWQVSGVDVLAMVPAWVFDSYGGGDVLTVDVFDGHNPTNAQVWSVSQGIDMDSLQWERVQLPPDAFWAGLRDELDQYQAWMHFDFSELLPEEGLHAEYTTIGLTWSGSGLPTVGYSNFNMDCSRNWTDYGDGRWEENGADGDGMECSWPMMKVQLETRRFADECNGTVEVVE